jgi:hypothetical protein
MRARQLAGAVQRRYPCLQVDVVNLAEPGTRAPADVFAVPTFVLNGRVLSLGTPAPEALYARLEACFSGEKGSVEP